MDDIAILTAKQRQQLGQAIQAGVEAAITAFGSAFTEKLAELRTASPQGVPQVGSAESMRIVLEGHRVVNEQERGLTYEERRQLAAKAGIDPRGLAGYHMAGLLEKRDDNTFWITQTGSDRLDRLS
jgi:hypothetical protein